MLIRIRNTAAIYIYECLVHYGQWQEKFVQANFEKDGCRLPVTKQCLPVIGKVGTANDKKGDKKDIRNPDPDPGGQK